jgi:hypothetical protein
MATQQGILVQATLLNPTMTMGTGGLTAIVFPLFRADAAFSLSRLSQAEAGMRLMACLVNARNLHDHGFDEVARLCRSVPAYVMEYGEMAKMPDALQGILAAGRPQEKMSD